MFNKALHLLIFFLYTALIYLFSVIIGAIITLFCYGQEGIKKLWMAFAEVFFELINAVPEIIAKARIANSDELIFFFIAAAIFVGYCLPFILWFIKPSILKAWFISLLGLFFGFGSLTMMNLDYLNSPSIWLLVFFIICAFYSLIYFGGNYKKKNFPDNKLANKIRFILAWPCFKI